MRIQVRLVNIQRFFQEILKQPDFTINEVKKGERKIRRILWLIELAKWNNHETWSIEIMNKSNNEKRDNILTVFFCCHRKY